MPRIHAIFTKRPYNLGSLIIRCANPVSIVKIAPASHVVVVDGNYGMEASATHGGVRREKLDIVLKGLTVVRRREYEVPDAEAGLQWARDTAASGAGYDWNGALGLGLAPDRNWQEESDWFCFEYAANVLAKAGRVAFENNARVTAYMLMSLEQSYR